MASSACTVQDGNGSAVASGNGQNVTPGNTVTIALSDSSNVTAWFLKVIWTNGTTSEATFSSQNLTVNQSPTWNATFTAPAEGTGFVFYSEVIATSGLTTPVSRFGIYCKGAGDAGVTFPSDPNQLILALQNPRFQPAPELAASAGAVDPKVKAVATSLAAYTGTGTATLTGSANGAIGTQDGVTLLVGDLIHLPTGLTNVTAVDSGPWMVQSLGGASAKYVLVRPGWLAFAAAIPQGLTFEVMQGTAWANSTWKATATAAICGTNDGAWYPRVVKGAQALTAGAATVSNLPIMSSAQCAVLDTTAAAAVKGVLTAGALNGSLALTGTTTDVLAYVITNW